MKPFIHTQKQKNSINENEIDDVLDSIYITVIPNIQKEGFRKRFRVDY